MNITIFMHSLAGGGAERVMLNIAEELAKQKHRVEIVLIFGKVDYAVSADIDITVLGASGVYRSIFRLRHHLKKVKPDILLSSTTQCNIVSIVLSKVGRIRIPVVVVEHCILTYFLKNSSGFERSFMDFMARRFLGHAEWVVCVSLGVRDDLVANFGVSYKKSSVIYNPLISEELIKKSREPVKHSWFASGQPPLIIAVGRLAAEKGYEDLIDAFALLVKSRPAYLLILGKGKLKDTLWDRVKCLGLSEYIQFLGFVSNPYRFIAKADLLVSSSHSEGFGNVLVEALALDTPVVATDCPSGPAEILEGGRLGVLVPVGNPEQLAKAIETSLSEPKAVIKTKSLEKYSIFVVTSKYLKLIKQLVA